MITKKLASSGLVSILIVTGILVQAPIFAQETNKFMSKEQIPSKETAIRNLFETAKEEKHFTEISLGEPIEDVFARLGTPDKLDYNSGQFSYKNSFFLFRDNKVNSIWSDIGKELKEITLGDIRDIYGEPDESFSTKGPWDEITYFLQSNKGRQLKLTFETGEKWSSGKGKIVLLGYRLEIQE